MWRRGRTSARSRGAENRAPLPLCSFLMVNWALDGLVSQASQWMLATIPLQMLSARPPKVWIGPNQGRTTEISKCAHNDVKRAHARAMVLLFTLRL